MRCRIVTDGGATVIERECSDADVGELRNKGFHVDVLDEAAPAAEAVEETPAEAPAESEVGAA